MAGTKRVAIVGAALSDIGRVDTKTPFELHYQAAIARDRRRRPHQGRHRRPRRRAAPACSRRSRSASTSACGPPGSTAPAWAAPRGSSWSSTRPRRSWPATSKSSCSCTARRPAPTSRPGAAARTSAFGGRGPVQFDMPFGHALIAKYAMATRRHMHEFGTTIEQLAEIAVSHALQRVAQSRGLLPRPDHDRRRAAARG